MTRYLIAVLLALVAALAPTALAQDDAKSNETETRPDDAAWVEDCPPDMMCAASDGSVEEEPSDGPTYDGNCGGEVCAYDSHNDAGERPDAFGPEDCIECSTPPRDAPTSSDSCMDGQQEGETCDDDKQYFGGPDRGPADGSCEYCRGDTVDDEGSPISAPRDGAEGDAGVTSVDTKSATNADVPAPALALALLAIGGVAMLALPRRHK